MAKLVLGFGSSHGPTIRTLPGDWDRIAERDKKDPRYNYQELLKKADPAIAQEITLQKKQERYDRCQSGKEKLTDVIAQAKPDVVIVVSNPHGVLPDDTHAVFAVYWGEETPERSAASTRRASDPSTGHLSGPAPVIRSRPHEGRGTYPAQPELASHLIDSLIGDGFDIASFNRFRQEHELDEAFRTFYEFYQTDGSVPMVPFILSRYLPSQAMPGRCYALGQALKRGIESWDSDKRVAIMASGGLSHQIIDQELDHEVIRGLKEKDARLLCSLSRERLNGAPGTPEILNWVTLAGAMEESSMTLIDYIPCYRSPAGTGHGIAFAYWN